MDEELDRFQRVNLSAYAATHGYRLIRREATGGGSSRGSSAASLLMRHATTDDKIVVRLDRDGHWTYFSVRDDHDNGTIIDFLQRRGAPTLAQVRRELRGWYGEHRPVELIAVSAPSRDLAVIKETFDCAVVATNHAYLNARGLRPAALGCERFAGTWRVDHRGDLLFPHFDASLPERLCGFERKNARFAGFAAGGMKTIWMSNALGDDNKLVFTEAVIDALSYHQVHPDPRARYASTSGAIGERQARHIAGVIARMPTGAIVVTATDNDEAGEKLAARIAGLAGQVGVVRDRTPVGKDWNEYLEVQERDYILGLPSVGRGLGR